MHTYNQHTARACANIALIKYWGKLETERNIPAVGSISMTLDALHTTTSCRFDDTLKEDLFILNTEKATQRESERVTKFLDIIRNHAGIKAPAEIHSENNFPTGAGLASSASGFAALALSAARSAGLELSPRELSILARRGSGSAARSIYGGFVEMKSIHDNTGSDEDLSNNEAYAVQLYGKDYWDIRLLVAVISDTGKKISSTDGMTRSASSSPYYSSWVKTAHSDLDEMRAALKEKNFEKLGELSEYSCLKMHALTFSSRPGFFYWQPETLEVMTAIQDLRDQGIPVYFTIDAGPQVKALCLPNHQYVVAEMLENMPVVKSVIPAKPGPGVVSLEEPE